MGGAKNRNACFVLVRSLLAAFTANIELPAARIFFTLIVVATTCLSPLDLYCPVQSPASSGKHVPLLHSPVLRIMTMNR